MNEFKEIETCLECSAKKLIFVSEVFYYALKVRTPGDVEPSHNRLYNAPRLIRLISGPVLCSMGMRQHGFDVVLSQMRLCASGAPVQDVGPSRSHSASRRAHALITGGVAPHGAAVQPAASDAEAALRRSPQTHLPDVRQGQGEPLLATSEHATPRSRPAVVEAV